MNMLVVIPAVAVDELAEVKAKIAVLQEREKALVAALKATGRDRIVGTLHEAVISWFEVTAVDTKRLRVDLGEELIAPYITTREQITLKVTARKTH